MTLTVTTGESLLATLRHTGRSDLAIEEGWLTCRTPQTRLRTQQTAARAFRRRRSASAAYRTLRKVRFPTSGWHGVVSGQERSRFVNGHQKGNVAPEATCPSLLPGGLFICNRSRPGRQVRHDSLPAQETHDRDITLLSPITQSRAPGVQDLRLPSSHSEISRPSYAATVSTPESSATMRAMISTFSSSESGS